MGLQFVLLHTFTINSSYHTLFRCYKHNWCEEGYTVNPTSFDSTCRTRTLLSQMHTFTLTRYEDGGQFEFLLKVKQRDSLMFGLMNSDDLHEYYGYLVPHVEFFRFITKSVSQWRLTSADMNNNEVTAMAQIAIIAAS